MNVRRIAMVVSTALLTGFAGAAAALTVTVANHSFELPVVGDGGLTFGVPIPGWVVIGSGVLDPTVAQLPQGPTDGVQVAYSNGDLSFQQDLSEVVTANTVYTLMVDLQSRADAPHVSSTIELRTVNDDLLATASFGAIAAGTNQLLIASFIAGALDTNLGEGLRINLIAGATQSIYDNVRLDASLVPEPESWLMLLAGLATVGAVARRRVRG